VSVTLRQSENDPPAFVASDGRRELALTPPDPALNGVWWARSEPFRWRMPRGATLTGGLLLPRAPVSGRVPLVIQSYTYDPSRFETEGPFRHAYAAQSLVARGMAVLNINIPQEDMPEAMGTPRELPEFVDRVNFAADELASRGIIDRTRVGLVGFSRGGYNTYYAITHPTTVPPAAAVIDDAYTGTYSYYLFDRALSGAQSGFERQYGGTFWHNKAAWLEHDPSFNIDRVETPALFTVRGAHQGFLYSIETLGAFSINRRPVEYLLFPNARHQLHLPRQRLVSLEATTDWMSFWLQGHEDPAASKVAQYARWRSMRADNEKRREAERAASTPSSPTHGDSAGKVPPSR
jgi:dipeptidyl aminopeptidase/acylaminoacyl peptidase